MLPLLIRDQEIYVKAVRVPELAHPGDRVPVTLSPRHLLKPRDDGIRGVKEGQPDSPQPREISEPGEVNDRGLECNI